MKEKITQIKDKFQLYFSQFWTKFSQSKFYANKMLFYPVTISLGLVVFILLIGIIFGGKKPAPVTAVNKTPTPVPTAFQTLPTAQPADNEALTQIEQSLNDLKSQITDLDVHEDKLQPPELNFKVSF
jgi:hypothetical protein